MVRHQIFSDQFTCMSAQSRTSSPCIHITHLVCALSNYVNLWTPSTWPAIFGVHAIVRYIYMYSCLIESATFVPAQPHSWPSSQLPTYTYLNNNRIGENKVQAHCLHNIYPLFLALIIPLGSPPLTVKTKGVGVWEWPAHSMYMYMYTWTTSLTLQSAKAAVDKQLTDLSHGSSSHRVSLITFADDVRLFPYTVIKLYGYNLVFQHRFMWLEMELEKRWLWLEIVCVTQMLWLE